MALDKLVDSTQLDARFTGIANAIRGKRVLQGMDPSATIADTAMADQISRIRLGVPVNVTMHMVDGVWVRPEGWANLDLLPKVQNTMYMTVDNTGRIAYTPVCFKITATGGYDVWIGSVSGSTFTPVGSARHYASRAACTLTAADFGSVEYPVIKTVSADTGNAFTFAVQTINGTAPDVRMQAVVEITGDAGKMTSTSNAYGAYYIERDTRVLRDDVRTLGSAWDNCYSLQSLDLSGWDTSGWAVINLSYTWASCFSLQTLDVSGWDTSGWTVTVLNSAWQNCFSLQTLDVSGWDTSGWAVTTLNNTWYGCFSLQTLDVSGWDTSGWSVTTLGSAWNNCYSLQSLDLSDWDTSGWNVSSLNSAWFSCFCLQSLDLSGWDTTGWAVTSMDMPPYVSSVSLCDGVHYNITANSVNLTRSSLLQLFNDLPTVTSKTITIGNANKWKLTNEEKQIATSKGWTIA